MEFIMILFFAAIGACIGSFTNVLADRLPRGEGLLFSRSHCDKCNKLLGFWELIPIFSYLALRGKCIRCKARIPIRVFLTETISAVVFSLFAIMYLEVQITLPFIIYIAFLFPTLFAIFLADLDYGIIPDELVILALAVTSLYLGFVVPGQIVNHTLSGLGSFALFFSLFYLTRGRGIGFGDVKLALALGFILGFPLIVIGLYGAFLTGALVSIILIIWRKKKLRGDTIPFGPFLVFSSFLTIFLGDQILQYFLSLI